jgi:hypothetical protein
MRNLQRVVTIGCVCIGLLVLVGTVSALFSPGLQAALTVPLNRRTSLTLGAKNTMNPGAGSTPIIQAIATTGMIPLPTQATMMSTIFLAQDTFQRMDQRFWGKASDGQTWQGNANSLQNFTIAGRMGLVSHGQGAFEAILGPRVGDATVMCSGTMSLFSNGATNMGLVLRWVDSNNWYKAYIDGNQLVLLKRVAGVTTVLKAITFPALSGKSYTLRFRAVGSMLAAKVWPTGQAEPAMWMVTVTDTALSSGFGGLRLLLQSNVVIQMTLFTEQAVAKNTP